METDELRDVLLELFPNDESLVEDFVNRVESTNVEAKTRIARSLSVTTTTEEEAAPVEEAVAEAVEVVAEEEVVETVVEEEVVLGETFVADLVASVEFRTALQGLIRQEVVEVTRSLATRVEEVAEAVQDERAWNQDTPARVKRTVVSYRPSNTTANSNGEVESVNRSMADIAAESVSEIFD